MRRSYFDPNEPDLVDGNVLPKPFTDENGNPDNYASMTILQLVEYVAWRACQEGLTIKYFEKVKNVSFELGRRLNLTPRQAVIYSLFLNHYDKGDISLSDIADDTNSSPIHMAQFLEEVKVLIKRRFLRHSDGYVRCRETGVYSVPFASIEALSANQCYVPRPYSNLPFGVFMRELAHIFQRREFSHASIDYLQEEYEDLVEANMQLTICQQVRELLPKIGADEVVLLLVMATDEVLHGRDTDYARMASILQEGDYDDLAQRLTHSKAHVQKLELVEFTCRDGRADNATLSFTRKGFKTLLGEYKMRRTYASLDLLSHTKITRKELFFDEDVRKQVDELSNMLTDKSFRTICKRLKQHKMRQGFCCLFYGSPGTGKTETVLQLARLTGRSIMQVDLSQIQDKYVGESEKNIKAIFDNYRAVVEGEKAVPILLFNEADGIISRRIDVHHSVDSMYNTVQNIILEEMEKFEGILIATTNLERNMDTAFERRFLYKVRFERPSAEVRADIWRSIIPTLSTDIALALAREFDFSGGQIENIARKHIVDGILHGDSPDAYAALRTYCLRETLKSHRSHIGFPTTITAAS